MKKQVLVIVWVLAAAGLASAQEGPGEPREPSGPRRRPDAASVKQALGLNEQQAAQLEKLRMDQRKAGIRRRADTQLARISLQEAASAATVDDKAVQARVKELADLQAAAIRARVDRQLALRKILSAELLEKLKQLRLERRRGPDGGGPGPFERGPRRRPGPPRGGEDEDDDEDGLPPLTGKDGR